MSAPLEAARSTLSTFVIGEQEFCIQRTRKGAVHALSSTTPPSGSLAPFHLATVITWDKERLTNDDLDQIKLDFAARDDVWKPGFLEGKVLFTIGVTM